VEGEDVLVDTESNAASDDSLRQAAGN